MDEPERYKLDLGVKALVNTGWPIQGAAQEPERYKLDLGIGEERGNGGKGLGREMGQGKGKTGGRILSRRVSRCARVNVQVCVQMSVGRHPCFRFGHTLVLVPGQSFDQVLAYVLCQVVARLLPPRLLHLFSAHTCPTPAQIIAHHTARLTVHSILYSLYTSLYSILFRKSATILFASSHSKKQQKITRAHICVVQG